MWRRPLCPRSSDSDARRRASVDIPQGQVRRLRDLLSAAQRSGGARRRRHIPRLARSTVHRPASSRRLRDRLRWARAAEAVQRHAQSQRGIRPRASAFIWMPRLGRAPRPEAVAPRRRTWPEGMGGDLRRRGFTSSIPFGCRDRHFFEVMNSSSTRHALLVFSMPRLIAGMISSDSLDALAIAAEGAGQRSVVARNVGRAEPLGGRPA